MKRAFLMIASLAIILTVFFAFTGAVGEDPGKIASEKEENILTIGVYQPLTGAEAEGGKKELLGIRYANTVCPKVDINGVSYTVQLLELDNASDVETAKLDGKYFVNENVIAVIGSYGSALSEAGATALSQSGTPVIQASSTTPGPSSTSPSSFRVCYDDCFQANVMASYAIGKGSNTAVVLTQENDPYSNSLASCFADEFIRLEGNVFAYTYEKGQNNFQGIANMIKSVKADVVFLPSTVGTTANIIKQLRRNEIICPILGADSFDSVALLESCSNYGREVIFCSCFDEDDNANVAAAKFVPKFSSWVSKDEVFFDMNGKVNNVSPISALGYDAYMVLIDALSRSESLEPAAVTAALAATDYNGVTGHISFDSNGGLVEKHTYIKTFNVEEKDFQVLQTSSVGK